MQLSLFAQLAMCTAGGPVGRGALTHEAHGVAQGVGDLNAHRLPTRDRAWEGVVRHLVAVLRGLADVRRGLPGAEGQGVKGPLGAGGADAAAAFSQQGPS